MITARRIAEIVSRGRRFRRHLPREFGGRPLIVSPDAALRWLKPSASAFEAILLQLVREWVRPGNVVWDIGANVGAFAFPAAHRAGATVVAVEADPFLASLLRRSAELSGNADLDVRVIEVAASDANGVSEFAIAGRGRATNGLVKGAISTQHGQTRQVLYCPTLTLDTLLAHFPAPDVLKVDVEGAELFVLKGAERLINQVQPVLYLEVGIDTRREAERVLTGAGYQLFDGDNNVAVLTPARPDCTNLLALTSAHRARLAAAR